MRSGRQLEEVTFDAFDYGSVLPTGVDFTRKDDETDI